MKVRDAPHALIQVTSLTATVNLSTERPYGTVLPQVLERECVDAPVRERMRAIGVAVAALADDPYPPEGFHRGRYHRLRVGRYRVLANSPRNDDASAMRGSNFASPAGYR